MGIRYLKADWCRGCETFAFKHLNISTGIPPCPCAGHVEECDTRPRLQSPGAGKRGKKKRERGRVKKDIDLRGDGLGVCTELDNAEVLKGSERGGVAAYRKIHFTARCSPMLLRQRGLVIIHVSERGKRKRSTCQEWLWYTTFKQICYWPNGMDWHYKKANRIRIHRGNQISTAKIVLYVKV